MRPPRRRAPAQRPREAPDYASTLLEPGLSGRGRVLRIRTDLARDPWLACRGKLRLGRAHTHKPPRIVRDTSHGSAAGTEGVHYRGEWIDATPGRRYWLPADMKGKTTDFFFPKVYVKGYVDRAVEATGLPEPSLIERRLTGGRSPIPARGGRCTGSSGDRTARIRL